MLHQLECFESRKAEIGRPIVGLRDIPIVADDVHTIRIQIQEQHFEQVEEICEFLDLREQDGPSLAEDNQKGE